MFILFIWTLSMSRQLLRMGQMTRIRLKMGSMPQRSFASCPPCTELKRDVCAAGIYVIQTAPRVVKDTSKFFGGILMVNMAGIFCMAGYEAYNGNTLPK